MWLRSPAVEAVIYAAGRATRLGPAFAAVPKILLEVGGRSLLDRHAELLARAGIDRLHVVTGHCREQVAAVIPQLERTHGIRILEIPNPYYTEGSAVSMGVSLPILESAQAPLLLMDGDVLYGLELLLRLRDSRHRSALLVDFGFEAADDDPVLVPVTNGRPFEFAKQWKGVADRVGESVGFFKVAPEDLTVIIDATRIRQAGLARRDSLDEILRDGIRAGVFGVEDITGQPWTEIDFPHDVEYARSIVLPALAAGRSALA